MTKKYGLIGYPLEHSFSPDYFNTKFKNERIDADYKTYPLNNIKEFAALISKLAFSGLNVTIPYKEAILPYLDELDGEAQKNVKAIAKIVKVMHDEGIGYGSINHPVDTCHNCGYKGVIYDKCPVCQSENILRMRRITGYLTGDLSTWNSAKRAEERDRVKHG